MAVWPGRSRSARRWGPEDVFAPVGTADAYDAMHILALGIAQAGSTDADAIRTALEDLKTPYEGLIKTYTRPFAAENHDALGPDDYIMVHYEGDKIVPANRGKGAPGRPVCGPCRD